MDSSLITGGENPTFTFAFALVQGDFPHEWHNANHGQITALKAFQFWRYVGMGASTWMSTNEVSEDCGEFTVFMTENHELSIRRGPNGYKRKIILVPEHPGINH